MNDDIFGVHVLNTEGIKKSIYIADAFRKLTAELAALCPEGREMAIVRTHLQTACFFAKRAMAVQADNQDERLK